jgi:SAM-dependent methyltransferase
MPYPFLNPAPVAYYEAHAQTFFDGTVNLDLSALHTRFLAHLPAGSHILDAGCGSGRDARAFIEHGYTVTAFDASPTLAELASVHCGLPVAVLRLEEIDWQAHFDGIWACASLLHLGLPELPDVLRRLATALKPGGVLFASFKYGHGEREHGGRRFTDMNETGLAALLQTAPCFTVLETWITVDQRPDRADDRWLNTVLQLDVIDHSVYVNLTPIMRKIDNGKETKES